MRLPVANVHERAIDAPPERVGVLLVTLATPADELWPADRWPAMRFDGDPVPGAVGGHGPIRYAIVELVPGRLVRFRFLGPPGLNGEHWFEAVPREGGATLLRHGLIARPTGAMRWQWPLLWRPLHDALVEDALARAQLTLTGAPAHTTWSPYVRVMRRLARRRR